MSPAFGGRRGPGPLRTLVIPLLALFLIAACAGNPQTNPANTPAGNSMPVRTCDVWGSQDFFRSASPQKVSECLAAGADPNGPPGLHPLPPLFIAAGVTPLYMAVRYDGHPVMIEALVRAGADLELSDPDGRTVLHRAAIARPFVFPLLLRLGADPEARDAEGKTPMDYARENTALRPWERVRMSTSVDNK